MLLLTLYMLNFWGNYFGVNVLCIYMYDCVVLKLYSDLEIKYCFQTKNTLKIT